MTILCYVCFSSNSPIYIFYLGNLVIWKGDTKIALKLTITDKRYIFKRKGKKEWTKYPLWIPFWCWFLSIWLGFDHFGHIGCSSAPTKGDVCKNPPVRKSHFETCWHYWLGYRCCFVSRLTETRPLSGRKTGAHRRDLTGVWSRQHHILPNICLDQEK